MALGRPLGTIPLATLPAAGGAAPTDIGQEDLAFLVEDDGADDSAPITDDFQNVNAPLNTAGLSDDIWDWDTEGALDDDTAVFEGAAPSQPVDMLAFHDEPQDLIDQLDGYDDPVIDLAEATGPVQAQAPPVDSPVSDEWIEDAESDDLFDESAPVGADALGSGLLNVEDAWAHFDEFDHDDWQEEQTPVGQDAGFVPPAIVDDGWDWTEAADDDALPDDATPQVVPDQLVDDAWDWFEPVDDEIVDVDHIADAVDQLFDDIWDDETVEDVLDESAPVADAIQDAPRDDGWDWEETLEEFFDDWSLSPDAPLNPLLNAEDQWQWQEEFADDHWQEENAPTITGIVAVIFNPLRGYIVSGQDRRFIANGEDRRFVVIGQDRRYIVRLPT